MTDLVPERANPDALRVFDGSSFAGSAALICWSACAADIAGNGGGARKLAPDGCGRFPFVEMPETFRGEVASFRA